MEGKGEYQPVALDSNDDFDGRNQLDGRPRGAPILGSIRPGGQSRQGSLLDGLPFGFARASRRRLGVIIGSLIVILFLSALLVSGGGETLKNSIISNGDGLESVLGPQTQRDEGFTLIAPSYKRLEMLPQFLKHYATDRIPSLRRIVILWNDLETEPPSDFLETLSSYRIPVIVQQSPVNALSQRFRRTDNFTTNAVLAIDDDMIFDPADVQLGYQVWKEFGQGRRRMVGYIPRELDHGKYTVKDVKQMGTYSMVLTKAAFFHIDWMDAYWSPDPTMTALRDHVDEHWNCEDILMSFLHAHHTHVAPIWVNAAFKDNGLPGTRKEGISGKPGHGKARTACIDLFKQAFGNDTLVSSSFSVKGLSRSS